MPWKVARMVLKVKGIFKLLVNKMLSIVAVKELLLQLKYSRWVRQQWQCCRRPVMSNKFKMIRKIMFS